MPSGVGENQAKRKPAAGEAVLFMGGQPDAHAKHCDGRYIPSAGRADVRRLREVPLS